MNTKQFKKILKESLVDDLTQVQAMCSSDPRGLDICDFFDKERAQKLIHAGEIMRELPAGSTDGTYRAEDIEYIVKIIELAKNKFGKDNEEVLNFEKAVKTMMNISGNIESAMEGLKADFSKFDLF